MKTRVLIVVIFLLSFLFACVMGCGGKAPATVAAPTLQSIAVTPAAPAIIKGTTQQFTAKGTYSDSSIVDITSSVTWNSGTPGTATIASGGLATAVAAGTTNITASLNGVSSSADVLTVTAPTLQSIAITPAAPSVAKGLTQQFTAKGSYSNSVIADITSSVTWNSATPGTATIASGGLATTVAVGTTNITASLSGVTSPAVVLTVTAPALQSINVTPAAPSVAKGLPQQFAAQGVYSDQSTQTLTASVTWASSDTSKATISNVNGSQGLASTVATGTTTISATDPATQISGSTLLTVAPAVVTSIAVSAASPSVVAGSTDQFTATGTYSDSTTGNVTASVVWSSGNANYATVGSTTGLATGVAMGSTTIYATLGLVQGSAPLSVTAVVHNYSGSASVGDFVSFTIDPNQNTLTYHNISNSQTGTISYTASADGSATLNDPAGHLLAVTEVPGYGMVALMNNAGATADQLALITSINQQNITADSFDSQSYNMFEFRTKGGGVGIAPIAIDASSNFSGTEFMPFNLLGPNNSGFNLLPNFQMNAVTTSPAPDYLVLQLPEPPANSGKNYIFGAPNGMFLVDSEDGSMIGLPKAASKDFDSSWANTYTFTYYQKNNAYGPDGNSPEAGDISGGVGTLTLNSSGKLSLLDASGNTIASGLLVDVADTASLFNGTTTGGPTTVGELGDPCHGLFTFTTVSGGQTQQVFAAFAGSTVLLSSFKTATSFNPGDNYDYFYGVGTPQSTTSSASNTGNSTNPGGSSSANPPGAWNSLGGSVSATAQRLYVGSSANGDLLTFTIDPSAGTLAYYDVINGNRSATPSTITYTLNGDGSSTVTDPNSNVLGALELPDQALFVEMNNTGFNLPNPAPPDLVIALPQMNLTTSDFEGQNYNFIQMMNSNGDETIGSMAIDANGNFTANGVTPRAISTGSYFQYNFSNLDPLTFPMGDYPAPWIATTDEAVSSPLDQRGDYLFGYPGSLVVLSSATQGTLVGVPQASGTAFQPTIGGNAITGTYKVIFLRRQVAGIQNGVESGPDSTPSGTPPNCIGGWKCLQETDGVSMGIDTLVVLANGNATLTDNSNSSTPWHGILAPVSGNASLYGTGSDGLLANPLNGVFTFNFTSGSGATQTNSTVFLTFVPGTTPAVVFSNLSVSPGANPGPSSTNYQYRYGIGFKTGN
ncbi:MAG: Ig-like domain-containing protein [Terracidiphilus sp.]